MSWKTQIADVCKKVSRCTENLNKVKSILSTKILNSLYSSLVEQHFTYCVEVWGNTFRTYLQSLYEKQKRAIRIVCKSSYLCHSAELFKKLEVLPLFHLVFWVLVNLGFTLDCHLTMNAHVSNIPQTCYFELRRLASIRRFLTSTATATLVSAFVLSRIDYCNSLLFGSTHDVTSHLQLDTELCSSSNLAPSNVI